MNSVFRFVLGGWLAAAAWALAPAAAVAQEFPNRPITIVIPYPAGGTSDVLVRAISEPLSKILGQPVVIDNRAGASGAIGAQAVARAQPDGHTLLFPNNGLVIAALLGKQAGYDPIKDFAPVSTVSAMPMVMVANKDAPFTNLSELIAYAKQNPDKLNYATAGVSSYGNLATHVFAQQAGIKMIGVPYRGEASTTMAVRTGEAQVLLTSPSGTMLGLVKDGTLRILGVGSEKRSELLPNGQPIAEVVPGFKSEIWFGLLAPAGTPPAVIKKLNAAVAQVLADNAIRERYLGAGAIAQGSTPEAFAAMIRDDQQRFGEVVRKADIKAEQ
ncbi:MAG: tripartite tricarboxylate transporter substrate binding protein [Burkholderiaceae bacterium]|jgi:tripartite-type tricarboxylate transporter receptor subunit TctC|nr:tripartite tricarboxylate transporter substrate binding protein [Burkholderiaceae bacterium]